MSHKPKLWEDPNVGASKAAKLILGRLDRQLIKPAAILVRISGWVLVGGVIYLSFFDNFSKTELGRVYGWIGAYIVYMLLLEAMRRRVRRIYETWWHRSIRVFINLVMVSILVNIAPSERHILILAYTVPIFATVVYAGEDAWIKLTVLMLALSGLYGGSLVFTGEPRLQLTHLLIYAALLSLLTLGFELLRRRTDLTSSRLTEVAREFYRTLDLQKLMAEILKSAIDNTLAERGLIIIINPRTKRYVGHALYDFELKPYRSIEALARRCFVLESGRPFENPDILAAFNYKSIYDDFFENPPRSVMAEPLYDRSGQVIGVLNVAHNTAHSFDTISRGLLKEFAFLVGNAIANCFEHREVKLREARGREAGEKFVSAGSEDEAIQILLEQARQQIPHAEKMTLHKLVPSSGELLPIFSYSLEATPRFLRWTGPRPRNLRPDLRLGYGVAGHALELRDTILIPDVDAHPWFVPLDHAQNIKSLLVAPLFGLSGNELYGTISLESSKPSAFNLDDESMLTYLSTQASRSIARVRDFQAWREQGGTFRKLLENILELDLSVSEGELSQQITDAAAKLLGFKIARLRLLDERGCLVTKAVSGVSEDTRRRLLQVDLPYEELRSFLTEASRAESSYLIKHGEPHWERFVQKYLYVPPRRMRRSQGWHIYDALITPLFDSSGNTLGILTLDIPLSGSEPHQQLLELIGVFASSAGWMIELSRFQTRLKDQQLRTQSFIDTISQELAKGRDLTTICEVVVQVGAKLLSSEGCSLHLVRGGYVELTHSNYLSHTDYISRRKPISDLPRSGLTSWVAATGQGLLFNDESYKSHPAWAGEDEHLRFLPSRACRSVMLVPVHDSEERVMGVITLENKKSLAGPKDFDEHDQARLVSLANEFAKALEVIGLYEDIREWERLGLVDDLHDLINWYHSGVVMWIEALDVWLKQSDVNKANELMPDLRRHALTTVFELKDLHTSLLKESLEANNFKDALRGIMSAWTSRVTPKYKKPMQIVLQCPETVAVPRVLQGTIVRIASLAYSNALQHSGILDDPGIKIWMIVRQKSNEMSLSVIDNGKGLDFEKRPEGYGLGRMRQLTEKMNARDDVKASLVVEPRGRRGTRALLKLNLQSDKQVA